MGACRDRGSYKAIGDYSCKGSIYDGSSLTYYSLVAKLSIGFMSRQERIEAILHNFHAIRRGFSHGSRFSRQHFGMTMTQASVLMLLVHEGPQTMGNIAEQLGISRGAATQLLDGLTEQGLVERQQDETDKRIVYIVLSRDGSRRLKDMRERGGRHMSDLFEFLDDNELSQVEAITEKLANKAKEIRK